MADRPRFFDDLAGVAGGAFSTLAGLRDEAESLMRARVDETIRKLDLVKREDLEAVQEMAANARTGQEAAEARLLAMEARLAVLEAAAKSRGASEADPAAMPPRPAEMSAEGSEVVPASMPPGFDAPGSSSGPTEMA